MNDHAHASREGSSATDFVSNWRRPLALTVGGVAALLGIYRDTVLSVVEIWWRSETFAHGFLIFPISIWLIWRRRKAVARICPGPDYRAIPVLVVLGLAWLLGRLSGVLIVEQYAFVGMIPILVWMLLGWRVVRELAFPLGFLLLAVPAGEFLIFPMMGFTADFTVRMLQITGIPVFREGTFFSIPSGDWSVVEGCSGLRYLIASITLGLLYAYLSYRSLFRRFVFVVLATIFPVIANGLRAYMIVMIAHLSDMKLALGVDHFIYGWVFFGLVMMLLFWLGSFWAEPEPDDSATPAPTNFAAVDYRSWFVGLAVALGIAAFWPARAAHLERLAENGTSPIRLALPEAVGSWRIAEAVTDWAPAYANPGAAAQQTYSDGSNVVVLYVMYYRNQRQGAELINSRNMLIPQKHPVWKMPEEKPVEIRLQGDPVQVLQGRLLSSRQQLLTWRWNRIAGTYTANDYLGKWLEARGKVLGAIRDEAGIILAVPYGESPKTAEAVLQRFIDAMLPALEQSLDRAARNQS